MRACAAALVAAGSSGGRANDGVGRGTARALKLHPPRSLSCAATLTAMASVAAAAAAAPVCWDEWDPGRWAACVIPVAHPSNTYTATTQFVEMSRIRIEGLLAAFPKLVTTGNSQHTYVETESVRYVYQPMEALYLLLITNKSSNIMEDLETLRLLAKLVPEFCQAGLDEEGVREHAFDLILAFDEVRARTRRHASTRVNAHVRGHAHTHARTHARTHTHTHTHARAHTHTHTHTHRYLRWGIGRRSTCNR